MSQFGPGVWAVGGVPVIFVTLALYFNQLCICLRKIPRSNSIRLQEGVSVRPLAHPCVTSYHLMPIELYYSQKSTVNDIAIAGLRCIFSGTGEMKNKSSKELADNKL